jgi:hypothetical protein
VLDKLIGDTLSCKCLDWLEGSIALDLMTRLEIVSLMESQVVDARTGVFDVVMCILSSVMVKCD